MTRRYDFADCGQHIFYNSFMRNGLDRVMRLPLLAPALDFGVAEDLADHAAKKTFQVRVVQVLEGADGLFFLRR